MVFECPDIRARFGARLRCLCTRRGMTQVELADYLGLRRTYVSDLERGKRNVFLLTLQAIARGFGLSLSQLLRKI